MTEEGAPLVGVITIWYRAGREIDRFLANMQSLQYPRLRHAFVINAQTAEEVGRLRAAVPHALYIQPNRNLGCAAGWNLGIRRLLKEGARYIGIWNVDVGLHPCSLKILVATMESDPRIGACQPLLLHGDAPHQVEMYGGSANVRAGVSSHDYCGATDLQALPRLRDAQYLDGGTMLIRADALRKVGEFDELLFMYGEDVDMSLRIRAMGFRTVAVRDAHAWHYHRVDKGPHPAPYEVFYQTRNRLYLARKYAGRRAWQGLAVRMAWEAPRLMAHYLRRSQGALARAYVAGIACGIASRMGQRGWVR